MMRNHSKSKIDHLVKKGVIIPSPESVEIGSEIDTDRVCGSNVTIYSGCKIYGSSTLILQGTALGYEGPVTIENCQIGPDVELRGGFFKDAVFLEKAKMGLGAHVREGTILEEESNGAHTVALKQTILFPFVTLGSLINFCDCLMSGGTSRKDHSEVGSSYIHFNYTPNQDKATPSLIGDVPSGVMLNQKPIFLGGQGGLVGPSRLMFGNIIAAGTIFRKDSLKQDRLLFAGQPKSGNIHFTIGIYQNIKRIMLNNIIYIANLAALMQWYVHVRSLFISNDFPDALLAGLKEKLNIAIDERIRQLKIFCDKMPDSADKYKEMAEESASKLLLKQKNELFSRWVELESFFMDCRKNEGDNILRNVFLEAVNRKIKTSGKHYISVIKGLDHEDTKTGIMWLQGIVDQVTAESLKIIPSFA